MKLQLFIKILISSFLLFSFYNQATESEQADKIKIALFIDELPITTAQFKQVKKRLRGRAIAHFSQFTTHNSGDNFWRTCFAGISPNTWLHQASVNELIDSQIKLRIMFNYGVADEQLTLTKLQALMVEENNKRSDNLAKNKVVYGLKSYNFNQFKSNFLSNGHNKVITQIKQQQKFSQQQLQRYYQANKNIYFVATTKFSIAAIKLTEQKVQKTLNSEKALMNDLQSLTFEQLISKYQQNEQQSEQQVLFKDFSAYSRKSDEFIWSELIDVANNKKQGDIFKVADIDNQQYLVKIIKKGPRSAIPFDEVKHIIESRLAELYYQKLIDKIRLTLTINDLMIGKPAC